MPCLEADGDGVLLLIRLSPRASRDAIRGEHDGRVKITLTSPPLDGRANNHLLKFLSKVLKVPPAAVVLLHGRRSRNKLIRVAGLDVKRAQDRLFP